MTKYESEEGIYIIGKEVFRLYRNTSNALVVETSDGPIVLHPRFFKGDTPLTKEEIKGLISKEHPKSKTLENWLKEIDSSSSKLLSNLQLMPEGIWTRESEEEYLIPDGPGPVLPTNPKEDKQSSQSLPKCTEEGSLSSGIDKYFRK